MYGIVQREPEHFLPVLCRRTQTLLGHLLKSISLSPYDAPNQKFRSTKDWSCREASEKRGVLPTRAAAKAVEMARARVDEMELGAAAVGPGGVAAGVEAMRRTKPGPRRGSAFLSER